MLTLNTDASRLNSSYSRITRQAGLSSILPTSHHISQENLRKWEKSARQATVVCNQAANFNRCLFKVQQDLQSPLSEAKAKARVLQRSQLPLVNYLMDFNSSIIQAVAKTWSISQTLFSFPWGNLTLARRDSYWTHVKTGIKPDTLAALRTAVETYTRSEQSKSIPQGAKIQNGDTGNHQDLPPARGVGYFNRLQRCVLPHTNTGTVQEISKISCPEQNISVQSTAIRTVHSSHGVSSDSKGGETDGHTQGYKDPPVPRRLVDEVPDSTEFVSSIDRI